MPHSLRLYGVRCISAIHTSLHQIEHLWHSSHPCMPPSTESSGVPTSIWCWVISLITSFLSCLVPACTRQKSLEDTRCASHVILEARASLISVVYLRTSPNKPASSHKLTTYQWLQRTASYLKLSTNEKLTKYKIKTFKGVLMLWYCSSTRRPWSNLLLVHNRAVSIGI